LNHSADAVTCDPTLWRVCSLGDISWEQLDGEWFVFNGASGNTHYVNEASAKILRRLSEGPATAGALYDMLGKPDDPTYLNRLASHLQVLSGIGLIEPVGT